MVTTTPSSDFAATRTPSLAQPAATTRDPRLDFYRGLAMFIILVAHTPGNWWTRWIPARFGFSDATEIFVFCSGMASAVAFGAAFRKRGFAMGCARVVFRIWQVYWAHIGLFFFVAMTMAALQFYGDFEKSYVGSLNLWPFFNNPMPQLVGLFTLTYVPNYFDILPMYLAILAMMPLMMALSRVHVGLVFVAMAGLWLSAQSALMAGLGLPSLNFPAEPWSEREWFFNPFGWQLVFFTGFAFMMGWIPKPPVTTWLIALAAIVVLANIPFSNIGVRNFGLDWHDAWREFARDWRVENRAWFHKTDFGPLRYLHFLALAYLAWVVAGDGGRNLIARGAGLGARVWAVLLRLITKVGQQSLAVFVFSMAAARLSGFTLDQMGRSADTVALVNLIGFVLLICVAYTAAWFKGAPWRRKPA